MHYQTADIYAAAHKLEYNDLGVEPQQLYSNDFIPYFADSSDSYSVSENAVPFDSFHSS
jgi:hypothetical protein